MRPEPPTVEGEVRYLTAEEVAPRLRTTTHTIVRLCRTGRLPATKPAGTWLIPADELEAHIEASRNSRGAA